MTQVLRKHVCGVIVAVNKEDFDFAFLYYLSYVVEAYIYVFLTRLGHRVRRHKYGSLVIPADRYGFQLVSNLAE